MCIFTVPHSVFSGCASTLVRLFSCVCAHVQNRETCVPWSEGCKEAAGDSGLVGGPQHTVGVFVLDNI